MGTTAAGLRYPEATDRVADGATNLRQLADDVTALPRARLLRAGGNLATITTQSAALGYWEALNLDTAMPASAVPGDGSALRLLLQASADTLYRGTGGGGPVLRWKLNGAVVGTTRNPVSYAPQNIWTHASTVDYATAPALGASFTLRLEYATHTANALCDLRNIVGTVTLV